MVSNFYFLIALHGEMDLHLYGRRITRIFDKGKSIVANGVQVLGIFTYKRVRPQLGWVGQVDD